MKTPPPPNPDVTLMDEWDAVDSAAECLRLAGEALAGPSWSSDKAAAYRDLARIWIDLAREIRYMTDQPDDGRHQRSRADRQVSLAAPAEFARGGAAAKVARIARQLARKIHDGQLPVTLGAARKFLG